MKDDRLPTSPTVYTSTVQPWERKRQRGNVYEYKYSFNEIIMDFDPDDVLIESAMHELDDERLYYRYPGKPAVMIHDNNVLGHCSFRKEPSQEQAYYVLSQLEYDGYVTGWSKTSKN